MFLTFAIDLSTRVPCVDLSEDGICFGNLDPIYLELRPLFVRRYGRSLFQWVVVPSVPSSW